MDARRRAVPALAGLIVFVVLGRAADIAFYREWWFFVGLGTALSATFVEPFFSRPQDGLINGLGGLGAFFSANHRGVEPLWDSYGVACGIVVLASLVAMLLPTPSPRARLKWLANRVASRMGRAHLIGFAALLIELLSRADSGVEDWQFLAFGSAALLLALAVNWHLLLVNVSGRTAVVSEAAAALGPHLLLVSGGDGSLPLGESVTVRGSSGSTVGYVTGRMSHQHGLQYEVALADEWTSVCSAFPAEVELGPVIGPQQTPIVGVAREGSTDVNVKFRPLRRVRVGDAFLLEDRGREVLYQVTAVELERATWNSAQALVESAEGRQVGALSGDGWLRLTPILPRPHQPLLEADAVKTDVPDGYARLGVVAGSAVAVGIATDPATRSHIAVLGMSGMGKTSIARRLATVLGSNSLVVAADTTGEYRTRLGFTPWDDDLSGVGHFVREPGGDPSLRCKQLVESFMTAGSTEYQAGQEPRPRVVLLEEAHTFIPEWNFAGRSQQDNVNDTTRMIMQARKFRLTFIIVSQRTAVVSKSGLSQCENYIVLKTIDETSLSYMEAIVGNDMRRAIAGLHRYEALCVGPSFNTDGPVIVRLDGP